jgi:hypothetical protein
VGAPDSAPELGENLVAQLLDVAKGIDGQAHTAADPIGAATGTPPPVLTPLAPAPIDWKAEAREVVDLATEGFFPLYPRLAEVWTDQKLDRFTLRLSAVMEKYDLTIGKLLGKWGPEIMLAAVTVPAVVPTYRVIRDTNRELREKAKQQQPPGAPPPAGAPAPTAAASAPTAGASSSTPTPTFSGPKPPPDPLNLAARA